MNMKIKEKVYRPDVNLMLFHHGNVKASGALSTLMPSHRTKFSSVLNCFPGITSQQLLGSWFNGKLSLNLADISEFL